VIVQVNLHVLKKSWYYVKIQQQNHKYLFF
jgi:hypothetical protein